MRRQLFRAHGGFSLIEAVLVIFVIGICFIGMSYLFANITQESLKADLTVLATKLAKEKMEEVIQLKADSGYSAVSAQSAQNVQSGAWTFSRLVSVSYVNPADLSGSVADTGYKRVDVAVSWGVGGGKSVTLSTLVTNMVPSSVVGPGYPSCP